MTEVKIIWGSSLDSLEEKINKFLLELPVNKKVRDIKPFSQISYAVIITIDVEV